MKEQVTTQLRVKKSDPMGILIVDDRPENLLTLESIIEKDSRKIIKALGGNEALRLAIRENIGLIMLDIQMPEIDGIEVARLLRSNSRTRHIPIIFVSAINNTEKPCMVDFAEGTVDCLHKPLDMDETRNKVTIHEQMYYLKMECDQMKAEAEKSARQLEQFMYIVSHDLKAPLRAIENLSNWISDDLGGSIDNNVSENLSLMRSRVHRMRTLLEGVHEFSKCGNMAEVPEQINLNHLVHAIFESIVPPAGFQISASGLPVVLTEHSRMYNIFYHLIKNAVMHHHDQSNGSLNISCTSDDHHYYISITDNGPGIKPQYAQKVFELFSTLKSKDEMETPGIGLPVVRKLLQDIGEDIRLDTEYASGARFTFTLPVIG